MKKTVGIIVLILLSLAGATPAVFGWLLRDNLQSAITQLPGSEAFELRITDSRAGWLRSEFSLRLRGEPFEELTEETEGIPLRLELDHGPFLWNLVDSPFALAHLQLRAAPDYTGASRDRFAGSGLLRLDREGRMRWSSILGFPAFDGDHTLQLRANWPARDLGTGWQQLLGNLQLDLSIDADALALLNSPAGEALRIYEQQGWTRYSQGRALTHISINNAWVDINGQVFPLGNLIPGS